MSIINGLNNIGNTCFFNATLQLLYQCTILNKLLLSNKFQGTIINEYNNFIKLYSSSEKSTITPFSIIRTISLNLNRYGSSQEDSDQYLSYIIDTLIEELNLFITKNNIQDNIITNKNITLNTLINNIFTLKIKKIIKCQSCNNESITMEKDNKLYLSFNKTHTDCNLDNLLIYNMNETLDANNQYKCDKCNQFSCASINKKILSYPKYLIIALKRYTNTNNKINDKVNIDYNLEFENNKYELRGFVYHSGITAGGHYVYYGYKNKEWYLFNDSQVSKINQSSIDELKLTGYIYLYSKI